MVLRSRYIRTIAVTRVLLIIIVSIARVVTTIVKYPTIRNRSRVIGVQIRIQTVEVLCIRIRNLSMRFEAYRFGPFAGTASRLYVHIIRSVRFQSTQSIRIGRNRACVFTSALFGVNILRIGKRFGRNHQVPFVFVSGLSPTDSSRIGGNIGSLNKHWLRTFRSRLHFDIIDVEVRLHRRMTYLEDNVFTVTGITLQANYHILPRTSFGEIECRDFREGSSYIVRIRTNTYSHSAGIRVSTMLGSCHKGNLILFNSIFQLRQDQIVVESGCTFNIDFEGTSTVVRILSVDLRRSGRSLFPDRKTVG